jgi:hypothetical protein
MTVARRTGEVVQSLGPAAIQTLAACWMVSRRGELHPPALIGTVHDSLPSHGSRR